MGEAFLDYKKGGSGLDINGIIEDYYVYAGEKVSAGDFVEFINGIAGMGTETSVDTGLVNTANYCRGNPKAVELPDNRVFITYTPYISSKYQYYGIVCTIDGAKITPGTGTRLNTNTNTTNSMNALLLPSGDVFVTYDVGAVHAMICSISGTTITVRSDVNTGAGQNAHQLTLLSDGNVLVVASNTSYYYLSCSVCSVSGTTVTEGTRYLIGDERSSTGTSTALLPNGKVFVAHSYDDNYQLAGKVLTISGTTVTSGGDTILSQTNGSAYGGSVQVLPSGKVFIAHVGFNDYNLYGMVCSVANSGTITAGTDTVLTGNIYTTGVSTNLLPDGDVFISYRKRETNAISAMICTISDAVVTAGTDVDLGSTCPTAFSALGLQNGNIFIPHTSVTDYHLYAQIFGIDEVNNIPTNEVPGLEYETQVRKATTLPCAGVAKNSGEGGDETEHKDVVSVYVSDV